LRYLEIVLYSAARKQVIPPKTRHLPMHFAIPSRLRILLSLAGLLLITAWIYVPALNFGLIWDDPLWYSRVIDKSFAQLVSPMADYHMYRPALVVYNRLFLNPDNTFATPMLHAAQIGWHLLNVCLLYALCRRLGLGSRAAFVASALFAWHPFSHQAVAWSAPAQPLAGTLQLGAFLTYVWARRGHKNRPTAGGASILLFLLALAVQENSAALCLLPLLIEWVLHRPSGVPARQGVPWLALVYPLIAAGFGVLWLLIPRQSGFTALAFEREVQLYLIQGFIFPLLGRPVGYAPGYTLAPATLLTLFGCSLLWLLAAAWRAGRIRQAVLALAWGLFGIIVPATQLHDSYVSIAPRLFYHASLGVALLWACALLPPASGSTSRHMWRTAGITALCLIAIQSALLLVGFQQAYATGTAHLAEFVQSTQTRRNRLLYVNFPSRYTLKRPPYPVGHWRVILAPGSVELGAFAASATGQHPQTLSRHMPWIDAGPRDAGPYQIDMRGELAPPEQLYQLAHQVDDVYLSRTHADGTFKLQWAGAIATPSNQDCQMATFGQTLCLQDAQVERQPDGLSVTLTWRGISPVQPHDTVFVHLGQPGHAPIAQADGDFWMGMLPLPILTPGGTIQEQRVVPLPEEMPPGQHAIRVGVYNRLTGERLPATTPQGSRLPDDAVTIHLKDQPH
jgi:hypothetical protein